MLRKTLVTAFYGLLIAIAFYLLAFGGAIFCCAPNYSRTGFWHAEKFWYGILPVIAGLALLVRGFRALGRTLVRRRIVWLAACLLCLFAVVADVIVFRHYRETMSDARIALNYDPASGSFSWGHGEVQLPSGFRYEKVSGIDTIMGRFVSGDGNSSIQHDIGEFAGEHGGMGRRQTLTEGSRVRIAPARPAKKRVRQPHLFRAIINLPHQAACSILNS